MTEITEESDLSQTCHSPPIKKRFSEWLQRPEIPQTTDEVTRYIERSVPEDVQQVLHWWSIHRHSFPRLSKVARRIMNIPASSATSERCFSRAGLVITDRRSRIDPDHVNDILFINYNAKRN